MAILEDPLRLVIGDKAAKPLDRALGLRTVGDLLRHYPRRYETRGELTDLASLREGEDAAHAAAEYAAEMIPVYPAAREITSWRIAASVRIALDVLDIEDPIPRPIRERHGLCGLADALRGIHRPIDRADVRRSRERLKWDEAFLLQTVLAQRPLAATGDSATPRPPGPPRPLHA